MVVLSIPIQTLYAEIIDLLMAIDARRSIGHAPGAFVTKTLASGTYYYFQYSEPGGGARQVYIGRKSAALDGLVRRYAGERELAKADAASVEATCAALRAGGASTTDARSARVLGALADAAVFKLGGVLVGTQAFIAIANLLGVRWEGGVARTEDVDIAAERVLEVAVPDLRSDVPAVLEGLEMGFLPVPGFSPDAPSTSFKVRGQALRLDLVTPAKSAGRSTKPVPIRRLNAAAAPVRFLDYLLEDVQPAAIINGGGVLVTVPHPARFAVHKLLVAQDRPVAMQAKSRKDVAQAARVIEALEELRPGDVRAAATVARARGKAWKTALERGTTLLRGVDEKAVKALGVRR
ncbi:MAG TPA: GSU2403 family nucleotidyltransferase fold protein [Polyangiaceae bacterium]|jgi:hypothetical protein